MAEKKSKANLIKELLTDVLKDVNYFLYDHIINDLGTVILRKTVMAYATSLFNYLRVVWPTEFR